MWTRQPKQGRSTTKVKILHTDDIIVVESATNFEEYDDVTRITAKYSTSPLFYLDLDDPLSQVLMVLDGKTTTMVFIQINIPSLTRRLKIGAQVIQFSISTCYENRSGRLDKLVVSGSRKLSENFPKDSQHSEKV